MIKYDPEIQGNTLTNDENVRLEQLKPNFSSFSLDEPELTDELVDKMKKSQKADKI